MYVTNNASRPPEEVAAHLRDLGVPADTDDVVTSAQLAAGMLAERLPRGAAVLVVGGEGLEVALRPRGCGRCTGWTTPARASGRRPGVRARPSAGRDLAEGARAVRAGPALGGDATSTSPSRPRTGRRPATARSSTPSRRRPAKRPDEVAGKPRGAGVPRTPPGGPASERPLVVGDRLDTDLEGARAAGSPVCWSSPASPGSPSSWPRRRAPGPTSWGATSAPCSRDTPGRRPAPDGTGRCGRAVVGVEDGTVAVDEPGGDPWTCCGPRCAAVWCGAGRGARRGPRSGRRARSAASTPSAAWAR